MAIREVLAPNRRNLLTLAVVVLIIVVSHLLIADRVVRYGAYLVIFSVWMWWFVVTFVDSIEMDAR